MERRLSRGRGVCVVRIRASAGPTAFDFRAHPRLVARLASSWVAAMHDGSPIRYDPPDSLI